MRPLLLTTAALLAFSGCGGGGKASAPTTPTGSSSTTTGANPSESAQQFLIRINEQQNKGQFGRSWEALHPAQQKFVGRSELTACMSGTTSTGYPSNVRFRPTESYKEPFLIWGTKLTQPSTAVTLQVVMSYSEEGSDITTVLDTFTQHAYQVDGQWRWIVSSNVAEAAKEDAC